MAGGPAVDPTARTVGHLNVPTSFSAAASGLPPGTTFHYRAVVVTDFGAFVGARPNVHDHVTKTAA